MDRRSHIMENVKSEFTPMTEYQPISIFKYVMYVVPFSVSAISAELVFEFTLMSTIHTDDGDADAIISYASTIFSIGQ